MHKRYEELDSLRGLAALFVVFYHVYQVIPTNKISKIIFEYSPLRLFISGGESVILFFVLSGFVLALLYLNNKQPSYSSFILKRICRIYLPYLFAFVFAVGCKEVLYNGKLQGNISWVTLAWTSPITWQAIKDHLFMLGTFMSNLNPVIWSLVHEMRISIIFPLVMFLVVKTNWKTGIGLGLVASVLSIVISHVFKTSNTGIEYVATLNYTAMFIIGALLAKYRSQISLKFSSLSKRIKILTLAVGLFTYLLVHPSYVLSILFHGFSPFYRTVIDSWFVATGASILIIFAINSVSLSRLLTIRFLNYLGKISYSLYLIHVVVILMMVHLLQGQGIPIGIILTGSLIVSFIVASLMYYFIEKPSIKLGRTLTQTRNVKRLATEKTTSSRIA
ncbi:acyltransferase family protein [Paenibacillus planticolens]|nr:acyltransferase [Paenibacillus planticolens]